MCVRLWGYLENVQLAACFPFLPPTSTCLYTGSGFKSPEDLGICLLSTTLPTSYLICIHLAWHLWSCVIYSSPALLYWKKRKIRAGSLLSQYNITTQESGPKFRSLEPMQKSGRCSIAVIPVLVPERGQRQGNPEIQLTRQSRWITGAPGSVTDLVFKGKVARDGGRHSILSSGFHKHAHICVCTPACTYAHTSTHIIL